MAALLLSAIVGWQDAGPQAPPKADAWWPAAWQAEIKAAEAKKAEPAKAPADAKKTDAKKVEAKKPADAAKPADAKKADGPKKTDDGKKPNPADPPPPRNLLKVALGPVREAPLLLPFTPGPPPDAPLHPDFKTEEQQKLLGCTLGVYNDVPDAKAAWKLRVEAGGNFRQGNTDTSNVTGLIATERKSATSILLAKLGATFNEVNGSSNRRFYGEGVWDRNLRGHYLGYAREELESDQVRRIGLRSITSLGLGYRFIDELRERWVARSGPTFTYLLLDPTGRAELEQTQAGWLVESDYRRALGEGSRFEWTATIYPNFNGVQNFRVRNDVGLLFPIGGLKSHWNWKVGVRHEYQAQPVNGARPEDTEAFFNIVYSK